MNVFKETQSPGAVVCQALSFDYHHKEIFDWSDIWTDSDIIAYLTDKSRQDMSNSDLWNCRSVKMQGFYVNPSQNNILYNKCLQKPNSCFITAHSNVIEPTTAPNTPHLAFPKGMRERKKNTIAGHLCNLFRINCYQNCCLQAICTALSVMFEDALVYRPRILDTYRLKYIFLVCFFTKRSSQCVLN